MRYEVKRCEEDVIKLYENDKRQAIFGRMNNMSSQILYCINNSYNDITSNTN